MYWRLYNLRGFECCERIKGLQKVKFQPYIFFTNSISSAIDHRMWKPGLPVRSAVLKPHAGQLVLRWVTTWESWLLIVLFIFAGKKFVSEDCDVEKMI